MNGSRRLLVSNHREDRLPMRNWTDSTDHRTAMDLTMVRRRARLLLDGLLLTCP